MVLPQGLSVAIDMLGVVLLHFLWQGAALGLVYSLLRSLCAGESTRYALGLGALAVLALAPVFTAFYLWPGAVAAGAGAPELTRTLQAVSTPIASDGTLQSLLPWLVAVWLGGVVIIAGHSLWQWRKLLRMVSSAEPVGPEWQARLLRLRECFQLSRHVRLLYSASALTPMLIGWIKPVILLPASMLSGFAPHQIELIIAHELGHIRRFDYIVNLFQVAIETVLFYHPVVHWISRDVRNAREACCDDLVLRLTGGNRLAYARALAQLEELRMIPALGAGGGALLARIRRIVGESEAQEPLPRSYLLPIVLMLAAFASLIWRQHATETSVALNRISAEALALVRGPLLVDRQRLRIDLPRPEIQTGISLPVIAPTAVDLPSTARTENAEKPAPVPLSAAIPQLPAPAAQPPVAASAPESAALPLPKKSVSPLHVVPPEYPQSAMSAGIEGEVALEYQVDASGNVAQIRVISAHPAGVFEAAAKAALRAWRFPAASGNEKHTQNFAFTLHGRNRTEEQCQAPTGSLICRHPGE